VKRHLVTWGPAVLWALVLFVLSELRSVPDPLQPFARIPSHLVHVAVYSVLGGTLAWAWLRRRGGWEEGGGGGAGALPARRGDGPRRRRSHLPLLVAGYLYGALDEWHQSFVPGRTPSVLDWVANVTGVTIGYGLALLVLTRRASQAEGGAGVGSDGAETGSPGESRERIEGKP
jgi:VanZ family protein